MEFEIGDPVEWKVGELICNGITYDDNNEDTVDVRLASINNKKANDIISVRRELLKKVSL